MSNTQTQSTSTHRISSITQTLKSPKHDTYTDDERFPLYYNTTAALFEANRDLSRAIRKQKRKALMDKFNKLHSKSETPPILPVSPASTAYNTPFDSETETEISKSTRAASPATESESIPKPKKWSDMFQADIPRAASPAPLATGVQALGLVLLRIMYEPGYLPKSKIPILPHGILNTGNICFMNAILQLLLYCEPFYNILRVISQKSAASMGNSKTPLLDATILFLNQFEKTSQDAADQVGQSLNPEHFYKSIIATTRFKHLRWGQQEDAEEFLGYLLDGLHEEFVESICSLSADERTKLLGSVQGETRVKMASALETISRGNSSSGSEEREESEDDEEDGWHEVGSKKKVAVKRTVEVRPSPITVLFGGQFRSVLDIPKNKEAQSITLDPFQHFQLDISDPRAHTLEDCFKLLSVPEMIPYKSSTNHEVMAKKQCFLDNLPKVFIIHLKRFQYFQDDAESDTYGRIEKLRKTIKYSRDLQIPTECLSNYYKKHHKQAESDNNYKLIGVVYHHGTSAAGGHYTVDVVTPDKSNWIRIDDTNVQMVKAEDVVAITDVDGIKSSYILMYERV
ncbi:hypothetical protein BABINDRAFT_163222 [Babjeviella inositovora NRRL Y-12698]|uniref:Ubiquitin carboxyl-terminal hydrolase n=1 Tax=Babjeviella inositovora NRRL Y-12698 TaxID=984486 RepID=A0A1E3QJF8_9ASCO|nr:uncharacterized protein BABINDRAFT_163222 [Babjeviella inositovora NRRL Y-12698]ODQ77835.1 hypothetical protein BABINDRAFT_163222 [Babjeviella inositovora NRRL Y-12698]